MAGSPCWSDGKEPGLVHDVKPSKESLAGSGTICRKMIGPIPGVVDWNAGINHRGGLHLEVQGSTAG